ncbi:type I polyketide synthase [Streptomyces radicis]|uniref:SDR family NAD(P)-dependent oxidoreductase n=1 Tax=Streptomyces radicis TaxID=1750517 RepID=A0A3A9WHU9_9ACTN|nr:type I polyketide synthase [Streptomyces radicis]RKN11893.1 SDR family NAD(P)-dependent oxidoreductase [Streptomyces radicis]RKN26057.1 SDR family NAD(P)-dependent oxidoreductase [Streptomyces radicis]
MSVEKSDEERPCAPVAVVGASCRLPGAAGLEQFWRLLTQGVDAVGDIPEARRGALGLDASATLQAGWLERVDAFDPEFFGIAPREAAAMDPQQRLLLELAWEALENAAIVPAALRETRTAVFASAIWDDYAELTTRIGGEALTPHAFTGTRRAMLANRLSYVLGLTGPSLTVDSGQSSSLVAVHLACEALRRGEATAALVGGVNLITGPGSPATSASMGALSPTGRCRAFDADADGYVRGEGGAVLVLKPLAVALAAGDRVLGVIRGSAVNNDGGGETLSTPRRAAQEEVLRLAHARGGTEPADVQYVELHGTGTPVGDPVEAAALGAVVGASRPSGDPVRVGSLKSNVGHLEGAAGIAGLLKVVLGIRNGELPASLHHSAPSPRIPLDALNLRVQTDRGAWPAPPGRRLAGVSSFGLGGTNCHVVVEGPAAYLPAEPRPAAAEEATGGAAVVPWALSGATPEALRAQAARLRDALLDRPGTPPSHIGHSLATTRTALRHRAVLLGSGTDRLLAAAQALAEGEPSADVVRGTAPAWAPSSPGPVLVFPGQGSQWVGMGRELAAEFPVFADSLGECGEALAPWVEWDLHEALGSAESLERVDVVQPVLWAVMVSLARLWESFGVRPSAVVGHSQGEIAAAVVAGVLSVGEGARVAAVRSRVIAEELAGRGGMVSVGLPVGEVEEWLERLGGGLEVAAVNGPGSTVVSGGDEGLAALMGALAAEGVRVRRVPVDYASHHSVVASVGDRLLGELGSVAAGVSRVPFYSTVTGGVVEGPELDAGYWFENLRRTVEFAGVTRLLIEEGHPLFIEASAHPVLCASITETAEALGADAAAVGSLRRDDGGRERFLAGAAGAWAHGAGVDWSSAFAGSGARVVDLPTYAFQRESHWLTGTPGGAATGTGTSAAPAGGTPRATAAPRPPLPFAPGVPDGLAVELSGRGPEQQHRHLLGLVRRHAAAVLGYRDAARVGESATFKEAGLDSHMSLELRNSVGAATGLRLPSDVLFSHPTPDALAGHLRRRLTDGAGAAAPAAPAAPGNAAAEDTADPGAAADDGDAIAIVGMACRYPGGVHSPDDLWRLVAEGTDAIGGFPTDRGWDLDALYDPDPTRPGTSYVREGGFLDGAAEFDAAFFGISPREALTMDPQQRLLLETSWEAVERAGIVPASLRGTPTGVFVGAMAQEYGSRLDQAPEGFEGQILTGNANSVLSGRVAYTLGLEGPAVTVDTACSSSLVSLHLAARALRHGDCSLALAGGVAVMSSPGMFLEFSTQRGLAGDGRCKAFAASADGTGWAEGVGMLVLTRLSEARRAGHPVLGVLRGSAINQDGASNGLTAPNGLSQQRVIRAALADAGLAAADVDAVEAHGTGTTLGDPIEAHALLATYGQDREAERPLWLGSLKSNIGHAQAAAGVGGVIKMVMAMRHGTLPGSLHIDRPSPHVDWSAGAVALLAEAREWPETGRARRAGVSSFGISGTNAHIIVEAAPATAPTDAPAPAADPGVTVWPVSARTPEALAHQAARLRDFVRERPGAGVADIGWSLATTRAPMEHRAVLVGRERAGLLEGLTQLAEGGEPPSTVLGVRPVSPTGPVFVFPGQGSQWVGMGRELAAEFPVFADSLGECGEALAPWVEWDLHEALGSAESLGRVDVVQPVLWAVMVSLARLWESFGVRPSAVVGHSQGEIAAAVVAGVLSVADGARVAAVRSRVIAEELAGRGGMVSVGLPVGEVEEWLERVGGDLEVAAVNGPGSTVVSGGDEGLAALMGALEADGVRVRRIPVDYASHHSVVASVGERLLHELGAVVAGPSLVPFHSTVTGGVVEGPELDAGYWFENLRRTVEFAGVTRLLIEEGHSLFVEASAHPVLAMAIQENADADIAAVGSLRRDDGGRERFLTSVAEAHVHGADVTWSAAFAGSGARTVELPTYAFQHRRYWMDTPARSGVERVHPLAETAVPLAGADGALLTATLSPRDTPWLADHAVSGSVLLPGTAFVELALRAGEEAGCDRLEEMTLQAPLALPERGRVHLQIAVGGPCDADGPAAGRPFTVHSRPADAEGEPWTTHATGLLTQGLGAETMDDDGASGDLTAWPPPGAEPVALDKLYPQLAALGYEYGPVFRGLRAAWRRGDEVFAEVALPAEQHAEAAGYGLHPALLDACLHGALLDRAGEDAAGLALPFAWSGVEIHAAGAAAARVRLTPDGDDSVRVLVADVAGRPLAAVEALALREVPRGAAAAAPVTDGLHRVEWVASPVHGRPDSQESAARWCVLGRDMPSLDALPTPVPGVVVAPFDEGPDVQASVTGALALAQEWLAGPRLGAARLAFALVGDGPAQAAVAGLVRSAQTENPGRFALVHLVGGADDAAFGAAAAAVAARPDEPELRVRAGEIAVPRLARAVRRVLPPPPAGHWRVDVTAVGTLDNLAAVPSPAAGDELAPGRVRVAVGAAGLNFRDVVIGLGMFPGEAEMGVEGAGTVVEVGPGVTRFAVGDRVMGMIPGAMGPMAVADARTLVPLPDGWTFERGAAVPVIFLTAWMGLVELGGLGRGDRILVHAATGGLGLAALQIARHVGAEVYATASPAKQHVLRGLGLDDDHIASTRDVRFRDAFLAATGGEGMDVVMNALSGEFTDASLALLPRGGRFVEMGKTDVRDAEAVAREHPGVRYRFFDLMTEDAGRVGLVLPRLMELFAEGALTPPPLRGWPLAQAPDAFDTMRRAEHIGKIVLTAPRPLDPSRTVLLTGGTGTLGALVARHLVTRHGVRHLLLTSRRGDAADGAGALVDELTGLGAEVAVAACDASDRDALAALLDGIPRERPLGAVFHLAGLLDDAVLDDLTPARVERVLRAKTRSAQLLDELTEGADLDAFVLFSSVAGVLGTAGQANYAAANAALDALARRRAERGLPAVSLAWGLWREASGMTGHLDEQDIGRLARTGVAPLETDEGLALLDAALTGGDPSLVAARLDPEGLREQAAAGVLPAVLNGLNGLGGAAPRRRAAAAAESPASRDGSLTGRLADATPDERRRALLDLVRSHAATVLRHGTAADVNPERSFREVGFDSLTAVELRNRINAATGLRLPSTVIFRHPTPALLAERLHGELFPPDGAPSAGEAAAVLGELDRLRAAVSALGADQDARLAVAARLRTLLGEVEGTAPGGAGAPGVGDELGSASDDEMFALIDMELGIE